MVYLFLDCDDYLAAQRIRELKAAVGDAELADLNITEWEAGETNANGILGQAAMMPFLALRRMVLVRGYLAHLEKRMNLSKSTESAAHAEAAQLLTGLAEVSDMCDLLLVDNKLDKRRAIWKGFRIKLRDGAREVPGLESLVKAKTVVQEELVTPDAKALPGWIQRHARTNGIAIETRAIQMLATYSVGNLRQIDNELEKLSLYAGQRPITTSDVALLVTNSSDEMFWNLTDGISQRNSAKAMSSLYALRRNEVHPLALLTVIANHFRSLITVKEMVEKRHMRVEEIAKIQGKKSVYPVQKSAQQAATYSFAELVDIMDRLVVADNAMKTGADLETEIDLLVAELTQKAPSRGLR